MEARITERVDEPAIAERERKAAVARRAHMSAVPIAVATTAVARFVAGTTVTAVSFVGPTIVGRRRVDAAVEAEARGAAVLLPLGSGPAVFLRRIGGRPILVLGVVVPARKQRSREHHPQPAAIHEASSSAAARPH
jgi:hypothetical protein